MKSPDNVLLGIALILLAGVILYNVFTTDKATGFSDELQPTSDVASVSTVAQTEATTIQALSSSKVNINTASAEELMSLTGIGPSKAQAIVDYRNFVGAFSSVDELVNVSGIGEKTLAKIKDDITV